MIAEAETFMDLFRSAAHWQFEIFLMILFDLLLFGVVWNYLKKKYSSWHSRDISDIVDAEHALHKYDHSHEEDHTRIIELEQEIQELRAVIDEFIDSKNMERRL